MDSADLGPAMALDAAKRGGSDGAVERVARSADGVAAAIRQGAESMSDPHDRTAVLNAAEGWTHFARLLRESR